jgi:hypothetical protein
MLITKKVRKVKIKSKWYFVLIIVMALAIVLFIQSVTPTLAESNGPGRESEGVVLSADEAYYQDAEAYVAAFGGTIEEAIYRLKLQGTIAELDVTLQHKEQATFAGLWIEHTPQFRVIVQLTHGGQEVVLPYIQHGPLADLVKVQLAPVSLEMLRASHTNLIQAIQTADIPAESGINLQANQIEAYVTNREQFEAALSITHNHLLSIIQIVEVTKLSSQQANWYAGFSLNLCTSGFSVKNSSGTKYSSTSGHCSGSGRLPLGSPVGGPWVTGAYDLQINPQPSGDTIKNWAVDNINDSTPYYRVINAYTPIASVGTAVCKYGRATNFTCGVVAQNNYNYQGSQTWLLINSTNPNVIISCGGDSGAPVYSGGTAIGMHTAGWCDLGNNKMVAMPIKGFMDKGYTIMTVP